MKIIIPSYRRCGRVSTLAALHPSYHRDVVIYVRPEELDAYHAAYGGECTVLALPDDVDDLLKTRQFIWDTWAPVGRFIMCDDDLVAFECRDTLSGQVFRITQPTQFNQMFRDLEKRLDDGAGVSAPRTHWAPPRGKGDIINAADVVQFFMLDGPRMHRLDLRWDRIRYVEDCDFVLQCLAKGVDVVMDQRWAFRAARLGEGEGGLNVGLTWGDRARIAREKAAELAILWPNYVVEDKRRPGQFMVKRAQLLRDARRKMEPEKVRETSECPGCGEDTLGSENAPVCSMCWPAVEVARDDASRLRRLARWMDLRAGKKASDDTGKIRRGRGRPPLGDNHPVVRQWRGKGPFRTDQVAEHYKTRNSAQVSLHNLVQRGMLRRVRPGWFEVVEKLTPEEMERAKEASRPGPDTPHLNLMVARSVADATYQTRDFEPLEFDRDECYCESQAHQGKTEACAYCQERWKQEEKVDRNPNMPGKLGDV